MTYPTYGTGTVNAVAPGATVINFSGAPQLLSNTAEADKLSITGFGEITILAVNSDNQIACRPWPFAAVTAGAAYAIIQDGASRSTRAALASGVTRLINALNANGFYVFVPSTLTAPDPSLGDEGQFARQPSTRKEWQKIGGVWTFTGTFDKSTVGIDGTLAAPAFSFTAEPGSGLYRIAAGNLGIACLGVKIIDIAGTGVGITGVLGVSGNLAVNTNKFTVAAASGNTAIAGTLAVTGAATFNSSLGVAGGATVAALSVSNGLNASATVLVNNPSFAKQVSLNIANTVTNWLLGIDQGSNGGTDFFLSNAAGAGNFNIVIGNGNKVSISSTLAASSSTTGALTVGGGIGVGGRGYFGGAICIGNIGDSLTTAGIKMGTDGAFNVVINSGVTPTIVKLDANGNIFNFSRDAATLCGSISLSTTSTAYNTSSDGRGKPNRSLFSRDAARAVVDALRIWDFDKDGNAIRGIGVIAQEAYAVHKSLATPGATPDVWWQAEKAGPVPFLVANMQQVNARLDAIEKLLAS